MGNRPYLNYLNCRSFFGWMFFVVVSLFLLINGEFAEAAPAKGSKSGASNATNNKLDCNTQIVKFNDLRFAGQNFNGSHYCVKAKNDTEAKAICGNAGMKFLNPGNPDYYNNRQSSNGTQTDNSLGFYFCYNGSGKQQLCEAAGRANPQLNYEWKITNALHKDGTCFCDKDGNKATKATDCSQANVPVVAKAEEKKCTGDGQTDDGKVNGGCICKEGFTPKTATGKDTQNLTCEKNATAEEKKPSDSTGTSEAIRRCVEDYRNQAELCKAKSEAASKKCDQNNSENEQIAKSINDTNEIAKAFQEKGQQLGQVQTCFKAGLVSKTGSAYLNSLKNDCNKDIESCSDDCSKDVMDKQEKKCSDLVSGKELKDNPDAYTDANPTSTQEADAAYFKNEKENIHTQFLDGINKCKIAEKNRSLIDQSLSALSGAINSALNCSCQLSANKSAGCSSTDMDCSNPLNPGCQDMNVLNVCTFGSTSYNAAACACVQTPQAKGCPEYLEKNNMNSGFAGADIKGLTNGPPSGGFTSTPTSGGGDDNSVDLGGGHADVATPVAKSNATGANFLAGGGGGAGGGASAPGGGSDGGQGGQGGGGEGPAEQKSLGVFGSLKSIVGSMFGGSNNKGSAGGNSGPGGRGGPNPNMDKFRPGLRGVASSGLGGRSGNIFELIKRQYIQQDSSAYIQGP